MRAGGAGSTLGIIPRDVTAAKTHTVIESHTLLTPSVSHDCSSCGATATWCVDVVGNADPSISAMSMPSISAISMLAMLVIDMLADAMSIPGRPTLTPICRSRPATSQSAPPPNSASCSERKQSMRRTDRPRRRMMRIV